jgi:GDSL-like Lipase/Acylhydrolase family
VAFIGGGDVAAAQHYGHIESLLAARYPKVRFRNFGWEGDTVFLQPRDYNFPPLLEHLRKAEVTVAIVQFGRTEVLANQTIEFESAYKKLLGELASVVRKVILVTPVPFEKPGEPLPDLSQKNAVLEEVAKVIRIVGDERKLRVIDLFSALRRTQSHITEDGLQISPSGHAAIARAFAIELGIPHESSFARTGRWENERYEALRQAIIAKNGLWFNYWRPQNWAFLGGDRVEQPSSRDHRDPKVRWFPAEMEKFRGLIEEKEAEIAVLAERLSEK